MEIYDRLEALAERLPNLEGVLETEEAAKHALVLPFIQALGYDVFNPKEVVPEFSADVVGRKNEKVDYAIFHDGSPAILIECKQSEAALSSRHLSQLFRYFVTTEAKIGVLTNGIIYQFFTDLEDENKMDELPFLEIDLRDLNRDHVKALQRLTHDDFDLSGMLRAAQELRYSHGMLEALELQLQQPEPEFVRWLARHVYEGRLTEAKLTEFTDRTRRVFRAFITERVNNTLRLALEQENAEEMEGDEPDIETDESSSEERAAGIITTVEEIEAYEIVKDVLQGVVDPEHVVMRDAKAYCAVLFDNNNRRPICRFRFGKTKKVLGLMDAEKREHKQVLNSLSDIYKHTDDLRSIALHWSSDVARLD